MTKNIRCFDYAQHDRQSQHDENSSHGLERDKTTFIRTCKMWRVMIKNFCFFASLKVHKIGDYKMYASSRNKSNHKNH